MKQTVVVFFLLVVMAFSFLPSTKAAPLIIDIGTIPYEKYQNIVINQSYDVDLTLIYTPMVNDLVFQKLGYNPVLNITTYYIQSLGIPVDYTFKNDTKPSFFQDSHNQTYRLFIDYQNVSVPANPLLVPYVNLSLRYNDSMRDFSLRINDSLINLSRVNMSLRNMTLQMNASLVLMNQSLINETKKYNATYQQLLYMSLNASIENTRADELAVRLKNDDDLLFRITLVSVPVILFCCILSIWIGKKAGWMNQKENRAIKKIESGYSQTSEKIDDFVRKKNDEITIEKQGKPVEQKTEEASASPVIKQKKPGYWDSPAGIERRKRLKEIMTKKSE